MKWYRADLHIHSVLSPCGDLDMSPGRIIQEAKNNKLDIIGISDHNSTLHAALMIELGNKEGITVFPGVEVSTREEVHCLAFFENIEAAEKFQVFLDDHSLGIQNNTARFGHQLMVNEKEEIIDEVPELLIMGINASIEEIEKEVHLLDGVFIPAHIDRQVTSIYSQIGFLPEELNIDAIEISSNSSQLEITAKRPEIKNYTIITNSDAHYPNQVGQAVTSYFLKAPTFNEWKMALKGNNGRKVKIG
jgi:PHP family Zn ribbon phosphoesterase